MTPMWREHASGVIMRTARKLFANTPVQKMPLTTRIYAKAFRFGSASDEIATNFRGVRLIVPSKGTTIVPGLVGGCYQKVELDVFERLAAISDTIVDVGASIGLYSCIAADRAAVSATIVAFEPVPENVRYLRRNLEENERTARVLVEEQAVGQASGKIHIYLAEGSTSAHSPSAKNAHNSTTSLAAPAVSIDGYVRQSLRNRPIDLLKVDVEGYECAVLRGARRTLREDQPTLFIRYVPDHLDNCGFRPIEFLDIVFGIYDNVFLVDEPRATFKPCSKDDLLRYPGRGYRNVSLIAMSASSRPAHHQVIESARAALHQKRARHPRLVGLWNTQPRW
ncbi:MAG TPA: FkbM family methyltransferase [Streptosporangiaceae bacterium]